MSDCTEPDRANCPRLCSDFCNEIETRRANDSRPASKMVERAGALLDSWLDLQLRCCPNEPSGPRDAPLDQ